MAVEIWWGKDWHKLCDKLKAKGYGKMTPDEKVWLCTRELIDSTNNGGIISYYYNYGADNLQDCMAALDQLEATAVRHHVDRVNALFPRGVPKSLTARNKVINSWEEGDYDDMLGEIDKILWPLMDDLEIKLEEFIRRKNLATGS